MPRRLAVFLWIPQQVRHDVLEGMSLNLSTFSVRMAIPNYFLIHFDLAFDDTIPSEAFADALAGACEKFFNQCWVGFEALEGVGKRDGFFFRDEDSRFTVDDDVRNSADVTCYNWQAKFHRFNEYDAEPFGVALAIDNGGERKDVGGAVFVRKIFGGKLAREDDLRR